MYVVLPAAGNSSRMQLDTFVAKSKLLLEVSGNMSVLGSAVKCLVSDSRINGIICVTQPSFFSIFSEELSSIIPAEITLEFVEGGLSRQESVLKGLRAVPQKEDFVLVHDAARPCCDTSLVSLVIERGISDGAATLGVPCKATIKSVVEGQVKETLDRSKLWEIQTPQVFRKELLLRAHESALEQGFVGTDDCSLVERLGGTVSVVKGSYSNIKITTEEDLLFAQAMLRSASH